MGERRSVRGGAPKELRPQPVGHGRRLSPGRDGAVAHRPQAGVLAARGKPRHSGKQRWSEARDQRAGTEHRDLPLPITARRRLPNRPGALNHTLRRHRSHSLSVNKKQNCGPRVQRLCAVHAPAGAPAVLAANPSRLGVWRSRSDPRSPDPLNQRFRGCAQVSVLISTPRPAAGVLAVETAPSWNMKVQKVLDTSTVPRSVPRRNTQAGGMQCGTSSRELAPDAHQSCPARPCGYPGLRPGASPLPDAWRKQLETSTKSFSPATQI